MRTTLKIALPLIVSVAVVSLLFAGYQVRTERKNLRLTSRIAQRRWRRAFRNLIEPQFEKNERTAERAIQRVVDRFSQREHMKGIAVYQADGTMLAMTPGLGNYFGQRRQLRSRPFRETRAKAIPNRSAKHRCISIPCHCAAMTMRPGRSC